MWILFQKLCLDFLPNCYSYRIKTLDKVSLLILTGRNRDPTWAIRAWSDTWVDPEFWVSFNVIVFLNDVTVTERNI